MFNNAAVRDGKENHAPSGGPPPVRAAAASSAPLLAGSSAHAHSHSLAVGEAGPVPRASDRVDAPMSLFLDSPSYQRTRKILSGAEVEARLREGMFSHEIFTTVPRH